jgi:2-oxoglutarate dehydrogenase E1 component
VMEERQKMFEGEVFLNWGAAETLAYARLLDAGYPIRISGQDSQRGTFAHRHAVLHNYTTGELYIPLEHAIKNEARFSVINSLLSEEAILGYEYGYSISTPNTLVIWEAQYGDFANGAQVVIDQFISSGEQKWGRLCGLALFLPHGYEGSGPEHSSARLERYLQLCAQHNMQVCMPTTPAQIFHLISRQMLRPYRKPLIVMTPKSLLRHKLVVSSLNDLANGQFQVIIPETETIDPKITRRVILCSGKVYYDLLQKRHTTKQNDIALIRIEQLYPFAENELRALLEGYKNTKDIVWCQEEPKNQGAWYSMQHHMFACLSEGQTLRYIGRKASAAPAVGYMSMHMQQENALLDEAFA